MTRRAYRRALPVLVVCALSGVLARVDGMVWHIPTIAKVAKMSDVIALIDVESVALVKKGWADQRVHSRASLKIVDLLKGDPHSKTIVVGTRDDYDELSDDREYRKGSKLLVFLIKKGNIYRSAVGRAGVFHARRNWRLGTDVLGWPKPGRPAYPKPEGHTAPYPTVKREIAGYLK